MPNPANSWTPVKATAFKGLIAPRAIGRSRVRFTCGSRFRSQRSLIVQPAPRIMSAPVKNNTEVDRTANGGAAVYDAARRVENKQGKNK